MMKPQRNRSSPRFGFQELSVLVLSSLVLGYTFPFWQQTSSGSHQNDPSAASMSKRLPPTTTASSQPVLDDFMLRRSKTQVRTVTNHTMTMMTTETMSSRTSSSSSAGSSTGDADDNNGLKIAWLMSYPNSGTSYTGSVVRHLSLTNTGTNYGEENLGLIHNQSVPVFPDQPDGPFFTDPGVHPEYTTPTNYILTKTHCGGRCVRCGPSKYTETTYSFRNRCLSGSWAAKFPNGTKVRHPSSYEPTRLTKAVHLIRDPFDNVVSRFHLERKGHEGQIGEQFPSDRAGFRAFCEYLNREYSSLENHSVFLENDVNKLTQGIACRSEFFRYMEWHNLAMVTTRDLELETYTLFYDWYSTRFEETLKELFEFLELPMRGTTWPFEDGKTYHDFFTEDERARMIEAMRLMASPPLLKHMERFFV